jgi:hypothetical protein
MGKPQALPEDLPKAAGESRTTSNGSKYLKLISSLMIGSAMI